jgi:SAM-dependent methyltransferase
MKCKLTNKKIIPFMSFGKMPLANGFLKESDFESEFFFDMEAGFSEQLSLFQLNEHPNPTKMFNEKYPFFTGSSEYMKLHFKNYADWLKNKYLNSNSKLIEIGSNDGTFLSNFKNSSIDYVGFEPSENVANKAIENKIKTISKFFNIENIEDIKNFIKKTDAICASNVICHIPDLKSLILTIDELLSKKGVFVFEEPYMGSMFEKVSYDQIYDEHIFMFSVTSVKKIAEMCNYELIDILPQVTHGGSMRYVIARKNERSINQNVIEALSIEKKKNLDNIESCLIFKKNCEKSKTKIITNLKKIKEEDKNICGYAATSKSTTILNYCNLDKNIFDFICDTTKEKIGKFSPGTHIPIVPISHFHNNLPDVAYLFAWNHKNEIFNKEKDFVNKGGKWISHVSI